MRMKKIGWVVAILCLTFPGWGQVDREQCTSAVISPQAAASGVPMLWKNRDTGKLSNKVVFVNERPFSYLGLVNADSASGKFCYAGLNAAGFGIMNTVAYNLPKHPGETQDLEGTIMADALRTCASVEDFEQYIRANLGPDLGSWANFGVIDASGKAWLFELHNHGFEKWDAAAAPGKFLVNTNFARSGSRGKGAGYLRFERASILFDTLPPSRIRFQPILTRFTRDLGHVFLKHPAWGDFKNIPAGEDCWIFTRDCINRPSTASAVMIIGRHPSGEGPPATLWVIPGEPVCAAALPLWVESGGSPECLWAGEEAPMWRESLRIKKIARPHREGNKQDYLNLSRLDNAAGSGFLPRILAVEDEILRKTEEFLKSTHDPDALRAFQEEMAEKALAVLQSIR